MLEDLFNQVYEKFKINFYKNIFSGFEEREASLTATETFCVEVIHALNKPTINELTNFLEISQPNTTYKVGSLVKKGYVKKVQSKTDKREYYLEVTDKFFKYYNIKNEYVSKVIDRLRDKISEEKLQALTEALTILNEELMPEVTQFIKKD